MGNAHGPDLSRDILSVNFERLSSNLLRIIMAVRTRFDPQPNGVRFFSDAERDKAYLLATPFFFEQMRILLMDGWKPNDCDSEVYPSFTSRLQSITHYFIIHIISSYSISISQGKNGGSSSQEHSPISWTYPRPRGGAKFLRILRYSTL